MKDKIKKILMFIGFVTAIIGAIICAKRKQNKKSPRYTWRFFYSSNY